MKAIRKAFAPISVLLLFMIALPLMSISGMATIIQMTADAVILGILKFALRVRAFMYGD